MSFRRRFKVWALLPALLVFVQAGIADAAPRSKRARAERSAPAPKRARTKSPVASRSKTQAAETKSVPGEAEPSALSARATESIGSISVGHPHAGFLINGVRMPEGPHWSIGLPAEAYGTEETIQALVHCIERVNEQFPNTPRVVIGTISAEHGGALAPHKSHRTGRDADVALYYIDGKWHWNEAAGAHNLDRPRSWAFLRAVITETDVEFVLVDRAVQNLLEEYALSIGEDPLWIAELFHGSDPIVKHVPGHTAHQHVRFVSPLARERGRLAYDQLVAQGHVRTGSREIKHDVVAGDTLTELARTYGSSVEAIREANRLESEEIQVGQLLTIQKREDIRGARDAVVIPARKLPRSEPTASDDSEADGSGVRPRAARVKQIEP